MTTHHDDPMEQDADPVETVEGVLPFYTPSAASDVTETARKVLAGMQPELERALKAIKDLP